MFEMTLMGLAALLLLTGIIGGGFEIKEAKIPKVGPKSRAGAVVAGALCLVLAVGMHDDGDEEGGGEDGDDLPYEDVAAADEGSEPEPGARDDARDQPMRDGLNGLDPQDDVVDGLDDSIGDPTAQALDDLTDELAEQALDELADELADELVEQDDSDAFDEP